MLNRLFICGDQHDMIIKHLYLIISQSEIKSAQSRKLGKIEEERTNNA